MKVLIVEDNEDNRNLLTKQFRAFGHEIKTASNGAEALKQALEDLPDILVSDIQMPEMDGYQLCREWKQNDKLKDIPVVFYTATYTSAEDEKFALNLGAAAFIRKPTEPDVLIKILSEIIERAASGLLSAPAGKPLAQYEYLEEHNRRLVTKLQKKIEDLNQEVGEHQKTEVALRTSEERLRGTLDAMLEGYQIIGYDWRYLYINPVAAVQGHYDRNKYYEHTMMELYPGIEETDMFRAIQKCMQENRPDRIENEFTYPDGTKAWFDLRIEPVPEGILVLSVDISKRKKAESDVKRINRMLRTISECNQLLVRAKDEKELLDRICDLVVKSEGFPLAWVGFAVNDEEKTVRPVASAGSSTAYLNNLKISWADNEFGRGPTGVAIRTGKPCIARHGMTDSSFPRWRASAAKYGFNASIALPLVSNGTTIGSLNIYSKDEDAFNEGQVNLLTELTDDLAYGITVLRKRRELAIANESLAQSEKKYSTLVEQSNDGVIVIRNGEIKFANKQIMKMTGFSMEETIGKKLFDFVSPRYKEVVIERYTRRMAGEDVLNRYEVEIATKNGRHIPVEINAGIIEHEGQTADMAIIRDITERKKAEETLKESEAKYRLLVENIPVGVCIVYGNRILFANSQDEKISGYTLEELQAIDPFNVIYEEDRNKVAEYAAMRAIGESAPDTYNLRIIRKDGTLRWLRRNVLQIDWLGERATLVLDTDITESHKAEEALKESEAKYRLLVENIPVGVAIMRGGKILFANSQNEQMSGYTIEELKSLNPFDVIYEGDRARVAEYAAIRARGEPAPSSYDVRIIRKDGSLRWLRRSVVLIDWLGEKASLIIDSDITERKKAEEGLIKSEERFRQVADSADEWIWEVDAEGIYTYSSPSVEKILGYTTEEIVGKKHFYDFYPADVREEFTKTSMAVAEQKQPFRSFANPNVHKNGTIVILDTNAAPILDKDGNLLGYRGVDMDITERIKAEEALKESEHFLDNIIEHTPNSMWISDSQGTIIRINQALRDLLKITDESVVGKYNVFKDKQVIEQGLLPLVESVFKEGKTVNFTIDYYTERESQIESEEKTHKIIDIVMSAVRDKDGKVVNGICQHKDVTAQKQAEEALKESEERYRAFAESTHEIIQSIGTDGSILFVNKAWHNILGYSEEDLNAITLDDIIHPDSLEHCSNMFREVISGKYFPFVEAKFKKKDGSIVYVEGSAAPKFLGDKVVATQGFYSDVTERKKVEEALRQEKDYAQNIVNTAQTIILTLDTKGRIVDFNPYMEKISGYTIDEVRGKNWLTTFLPERNKQKTRELFSVAIDNRKTVGNIDVIVTKNGQERFIEW
jgi:PAS domain S-box-containing protein